MTRRTLTDAERIVSIREVIEAARGDWHEATALLSVGRDLDWLLARSGGERLDEAWNEAVAALPKRWLGPNLSAYYPTGFEAWAHHADTTPGRGRGKRDTGAIYGETATVALRNLAAYLREHHSAAPSEPETP